MKFNQNIFEFYNWINSVVEIKYIEFILCDMDAGICFVCNSKAEVLNVLHNEISMQRLHRKEYNVKILEIHVRKEVFE